VLEDLILDALKERLMAPELVKEFIAEYHAEINRQLHAAELEAGLGRRELDQVNRKLAGLVEAIADGLRPPGLQGRLDELEQRKAMLMAKVAGAPAPAPRLHPNLAELYRQKVADLRAALADPATRTEALEILRSLVETVTIKALAKGFEIELVGEIAHMVAMAAETRNNKAASGEAAGG
jgi:site-specific DNA recombinase